MKHALLTLFWSGCAVLLSGCAERAVSNLNVIHPEAHIVQNERTIDEPFDVVWDRLVRGLSKSFYVINNIEKASRIINVSFSSNTPAQFIDCGRSVRRYQRGARDDVYDYPIAQSSQFPIASTYQLGIYRPHQTLNVVRNTSLEGRVNVYVAPVVRGTDVAVNSRYLLTVRVSATAERENIYGTVVWRGNVPNNEPPKQHSFNTNQANTYSATQGSTTCYSTGKLETEILNLAGPRP